MAQHQQPDTRGLTLIELMFVMALVALLATIAIPRLLAFRDRALQAEAKTGLRALATSLSAYRADKNEYTDNLSRLGWQPDGEPRFIYGFTSDAWPVASGLNDTAELKAAGYGRYRTGRMLDGAGFPLTDGNLPAASASADAFTVGAAADLDDDLALDTWTLNDGGVLTHISSDIGH